MTVDEIKEKYADENGYVSCNVCPLGIIRCREYTKAECNGYSDAYEAIRRYFEENEVVKQIIIEAETSDNVNHPAHYTRGGIECLDAIAAAVGEPTGMEAVYTAQIIKYVWRWKWKNGAEDLKKARFYLDKLIAMEEKT